MSSSNASSRPVRSPGSHSRRHRRCGRTAMTVSVVLVHGGFLGPWCWADVAEMLGTKGIPTVVPDLPSIGNPQTAPLGDFDADAAAVRRVLDQQRDPVLLCGHSYGGAVITEAAAGHPAVAHLVYLTAAVPDIGQSVADVASATEVEAPFEPSDEGASAGDLEPVAGPAGSIVLLPEQGMNALFHDCSAERARQGAALLRPMNPAPREQPLTGAGWRDVPSTFVRGSQDRIPEIVTPAFFSRAPEMMTLPTGHCPNWSRPDLVAELLAERVMTIAIRQVDVHLPARCRQESDQARSNCVPGHLAIRRPRSPDRRR